MATVTLDTALSSVLGGRTANAFARAFDMRTVADLLAHYPRRYARRGELTAISELPLNEPVTVVAEVRQVRERPMRSRGGSILEVEITDSRSILTLTFFNQAWRAKELVPGARGIFAGKVGQYRGQRQLAHPDYELFDAEGAHPLSGMAAEAGSTGAEAEGADSAGQAADAATRAADEEAARRWAEQPIPIYPATSTVASWQLQKAIALVLDGLGEVPDPVPAGIRQDRGLLSLGRAFEQLHRPERSSQWLRAQETLRFQEAFVLQAALLQQRLAHRSHPTTARPASPGGLLERFDAALPFALTEDQQAVGEELLSELAATTPMNRLVQGEVGSGKTLVALRAMLAVAESGGQAALLAPTEVLAAQHLRSIVRVLGPDLSAELMPTLLTGQRSTAERKSALLRIVSGQARIVVGTHALLSESVQFFDLGLVVVDEQHRFGVEQREALRLKASAPPHVLVLTATPIPRTVAMTVFGDLDVSTIRSLPAGRAGISSFAVPLAVRPGWQRRIWERLSEELDAGRQAFVVCPAITAGELEESGAEQAEAADAEPDASAAPVASVEATLAQLRADPLLAGRRIEALHGRLPGDAKDRIMQDFAAGAIDVLVATTVIEVGVDVPNASAMVVLDADRFGVSQLHQLRGRVGRGGHPGLALFVTNAAEGTIALERVEAVAATTDGFELAEKDLELRREGDVLGAEQSGGRSSLRLLRVVQDAELIVQARALVEQLLADDPSLQRHPELAEALQRRLDESERRFLGKG